MPSFRAAKLDRLVEYTGFNKEEVEGFYLEGINNDYVGYEVTSSVVNPDNSWDLLLSVNDADTFFFDVSFHLDPGDYLRITGHAPDRLTATEYAELYVP